MHLHAGKGVNNQTAAITETSKTKFRSVNQGKSKSTLQKSGWRECKGKDQSKSIPAGHIPALSIHPYGTLQLLPLIGGEASLCPPWSLSSVIFSLECLSQILTCLAFPRLCTTQMSYSSGLHGWPFPKPWSPSDAPGGRKSSHWGQMPGLLPQLNSSLSGCFLVYDMGAVVA